MSSDLNFEKDQWVCPNCGEDAKQFYCGNCGFRIYAGFKERFFSNLIDELVLLIIIGPIVLSENNSVGSNFAGIVLLLLAVIFYLVFPTGMFGQTLGKILMRVKVVRLDGSNITQSNAWRWYFVEVFLLVCLILILGIMWQKNGRNATINFASSADPHLAIWFEGLFFASKIYSWSEIFVLLTNKKRRALHDYIAGTVVIHDPQLGLNPFKRAERKP
jgi:uncharacterized RDD family membrane protein YckC